MRLFLIIILILCSSCTSKEERAQNKARWKALYAVAEKEIVQTGRIKLACEIAANAKIHVKKEQYTDYKTEVVGSESWGGQTFCNPNGVGGQYCYTLQDSRDITQEVPYLSTRDANVEKRAEFKDACGCRNKDFNYVLPPNFDVGDITYSEKYLIDNWKEQIPSRLGKWTVPLKKERKTHCMAKDEYFKKQPWYQRIPIVKHK